MVEENKDTEQPRKCSIETCDRKHYAKNYCKKHYDRLKRIGTADDSAVHKKLDFIITDNNCFEVSTYAPVSKGRGYRRIVINGIRKSLHRFIYEECFGEIPNGLVVRHKCDNEKCINPEHLELGTQADNARDKVVRDRSLYGDRNPHTKLSNDDVREIKQLIHKGERNIDIARKFNVRPEVISKIKIGLTWTKIV